VIRASNAHKRQKAPSFACLVGLETLMQKDGYRSKIEKASELGVSYIVTGVEQEQNYLEFLRFLAADIMPSFR